ncbi:MAG: c(7)-type cytochrome triheme domain-containing protein [Candidatus Thiodiazotropha sp.]
MQLLKQDNTYRKVLFTQSLDIYTPDAEKGDVIMKSLCSLVVLLVLLSPSFQSKAEYGDVVINNYSTEAGINPVVFPHWFHRIRFTCKVCHHDLGIHFEAGDNNIKMLDIINGRYCGGCHNGDVAWGIDKCDLCHSGEKTMQTRGNIGAQKKLQEMKKSQKKVVSGE